MAETIKPSGLSDAIERELKMYSEDVTKSVNEAGAKSIKRLKKLTKATAPVASGDYKRHIATREDPMPGTGGMKKYTWYVKAPDYRLTHLLAYGHATRNGGRTRANPFLHNAVNTVLPEYEKAVEEACKGD